MVQAAIKNTKKTNKTVWSGLLTVAVTLLLCACGDDPNTYFFWKLRGTEEKTYAIKLIGTAKMEADLFGFDRDSLTVRGKPLTVSLRDESFLVVKNQTARSLQGEVISNKSAFTTYPDPDGSKPAIQTLNALFRKNPGVSSGQFEIEGKGVYTSPSSNPFFVLKILLRAPEEDILKKKQGVMQMMGYAQESLCLTIHNRKIRSLEQENKVNLISLSKNREGDVIADMHYTLTEKIETEYKEGDPFRRAFIKRFNDGNYLGLRPLPEDEENVQKIFTCRYKGRHVFNLTRGWIESVIGEHSIEMTKMLHDGPRSAEILRSKVKMEPSQQKVQAKETVDELELMAGTKPDETPLEKSKDTKLTNMLEDRENNQAGPKDIPKALPSGNALPDPDVDIQDIEPAAAP